MSDPFGTRGVPSRNAGVSREVSRGGVFDAPSVRLNLRRDISAATEGPA